MSVRSQYWENMDRAFFDTNILLDVLQRREPFYPASFKALNLAISCRCHGSVSPVSVSDIVYVARKVDRSTLIRFFGLLRSRLDITPVTGVEVDAMLCSKWGDMEDALQYAAAMSWGATCFVTRNTSDFAQLPALPVLSPDEFLARVAAR